MKKRMLGIYAGLSVRERALLVLRDWQDGKPDDPAYRNGLNGEEGREFNKLIELIDRVHRYVGQLTLLLEAQMAALGLRHGWLLTIELWEIEAEGGRMASLRDELRDVNVQVLAASVAQRQSELACADAVLAEVSEEFGGEDIAHHRVREVLERVRDELADMAAAVRIYQKIRKARPNEALSEALRDAVWRDL